MTLRECSVCARLGGVLSWEEISEGSCSLSPYVYVCFLGMARGKKGKGERIDRERGVCEYIYMNKEEREARGRQYGEGSDKKGGNAGRERWRI